MNPELEFVAKQIEKAKCAEDVFGAIVAPTPEEMLRTVQLAYRVFAKVVFPEVYIGDNGSYKIAEGAFKGLNDFKAHAMKLIKEGNYGKRVPLHKNSLADNVSVTIKDKYIRYAPFAAGDIADIHAAYFEQQGVRKEVLIKVARETADNGLLETERDTLLALHEKLKGHDWDTNIPHMYESFLLDDGKGKNKPRANVLEKFERFLTVEQIRALVQDGVDGRTIAWMWKRLLVLLDWTHNLGYLHGAVLPPHVMYFPDNNKSPNKDGKHRHSVRLVDWCYAVSLSSKAAKLKAWCPEYKAFYAPEVLGKKTLSPQTDLYMGAKTMLYVLGGDVMTNSFPAHVPKSIAQIIGQCLETQPSRRPQDIQLYFKSFLATLEKEYGKPTFHFFNLPGMVDA